MSFLRSDIIRGAALLLLCAGCAPKRPPVFIWTRATAVQRDLVKGKSISVGALQAVELKDYKRAFVKRYGTEEAFKESFQRGLQALFPASTPSGGAFRLDCSHLVVDEIREPGDWITTGGGPHMPPTQSYRPGRIWAIVRVDFQVRDAAGALVLEGQAESKNGKAEFLHPNLTRLSGAVDEAQRHIADYLNGQMPDVNVAAPTEKKK